MHKKVNKMSLEEVIAALKTQSVDRNSQNAIQIGDCFKPLSVHARHLTERLKLLGFSHLVYKEPPPQRVTSAPKKAPQHKKANSPTSKQRVAPTTSKSPQRSKPRDPMGNRPTRSQKVTA